MVLKRTALLILFVVFLIGPFPTSSRAQEGQPLVILHPGHGHLNMSGGALDPGAAFGGLLEKDITMSVATLARDYLARCPVSVSLTHEDDDYDSTMEDYVQTINNQFPVLAVSIHVNASENLSGTKAWYTIGGVDDVASTQIAAQLTANISSALNIRNGGIWPETESPEGILEIHPWIVPSALIEIAGFQADFEILRDNQAVFAQAITFAILEYLEIPILCTNQAAVGSYPVLVLFPNESGELEFDVTNDGLYTWKANEYELVNISDEGESQRLQLPQDLAIGENYIWMLPVTAPQVPGIYAQNWQVEHNGEPIRPLITATLIVVPEQAREIKEDIEKRLEELKHQGKEALDVYIEDLKKQAVAWAQSEAERAINEICSSMSFVVLFGLMVGYRKIKKRRYMRGEEQ
jgi:N-acetylmuramoyl-L-alanine amidase